MNLRVQSKLNFVKLLSIDSSSVKAVVICGQQTDGQTYEDI